MQQSSLYQDYGQGFLVPIQISSEETLKTMASKQQQQQQQQQVEEPFELAITPDRTPNIFHTTAPYAPYPIELDVLPHSSLPAHQPLTHNVRPLPPPVPQRSNYNDSNSGNNSHLQPPPMHTAHRHPHSDFGDDSTMVGDKAEVETLRSDLSFLNTDSYSASYNEGQWIPMDNKAVDLLGRH